LNLLSAGTIGERANKSAVLVKIETVVILNEEITGIDLFGCKQTFLPLRRHLAPISGNEAFSISSYLKEIVELALEYPGHFLSGDRGRRAFPQLKRGNKGPAHPQGIGQHLLGHAGAQPCFRQSSGL
jgi:hypothetical protein